MAEGFVVFGARLDGDGFADTPDQGRVPGRGHTDGLREQGGVAGAGDPVEAFAPPIVGGDAEAWDGDGGVDELRDLFLESEAGDEVVDTALDGERRVHVGEKLGRLRGETCDAEGAAKKQKEGCKGLGSHAGSDTSTE